MEEEISRKHAIFIVQRILSQFKKAEQKISRSTPADTFWQQCVSDLGDSIFPSVKLKATEST